MNLNFRSLLVVLIKLISELKFWIKLCKGYSVVWSLWFLVRDLMMKTILAQTSIYISSNLNLAVKIQV